VFFHREIVAISQFQPFFVSLGFIVIFAKNKLLGMLFRLW